MEIYFLFFLLLLFSLKGFFYFHWMMSYGETIARSRFFSVLGLRLRWSTRKYAHACTRAIRRVPEHKRRGGEKRH